MVFKYSVLISSGNAESLLQTAWERFYSFIREINGQIRSTVGDKDPVKVMVNTPNSHSAFRIKVLHRVYMVHHFGVLCSNLFMS